MTAENEISDMYIDVKLNLQALQYSDRYSMIEVNSSCMPKLGYTFNHNPG